MKINNKKLFPIFFVFLGLAAFFGGYKLRKNNIELERKKTEAKTELGAVSFITPHHLFAEKLIENIFREFSSKNKGAEIERVVLISPNHFNLGHAPVVIPDIDGIQKKVQLDKVNIESLLINYTLFEKIGKTEKKGHGIYNIIPYVAKYFPNVYITPLMIRDGISGKRIKEIEAAISWNFQEETILILSSDFSHYSGWESSQIADKESIRAISQMDFESVRKLDMDCRGGLEVLMGYSKEKKHLHFNLLENSSSSEMIGQDMKEKNTSYVTGYFSRN